MLQNFIFGFLLVFLSIEHSYAGAYSDPHFVGNRTVIVHLMEWKYEDIAKECEIFLGPYGYGGVQLSPVNENAVLDRRPWWERYQPVSYNITGRSGNEQQLTDMVHRCNKVEVRVYVDVVLNHMTMGTEKGKGTANNSYDGVYESYPGVPYSSLDFHGHESCPTQSLNISDNGYDNPIEARNCQLGGLRDLNQGKDWVRQKQSAFLNKLIDIGIAGFRSDASKHQWPSDMTNIISRLKPLNTAFFPTNAKPFFYHEVISNPNPKINISEYLPIGRIIEFKFFRNIGEVFRKQKDQRLAYLHNWGKDWDMLSSDDALVMVDSHDLQRGHTGELGVNINFFEPRLLKMATAFMLSWPYAITRVMSSYYWDQQIKNHNDVNDWVGPPHDSNYNIIDVKQNPDLTCNKEWVCEHRWHQIYNMVVFRNIVGNEKVENFWNNTYNSIAFSRGNKGFIAINNDYQPINQKLKTGLSTGRYCDVITGNIIGGKCNGKVVEVNSDGTAQVFVDNKWEDPMIAIHIKSKIN